MTALVHLVPVDDLVKILVGPTTWRPVDLARENRDRDRDFRNVYRGEGSPSKLRSIPVGSRRGRAGVREPVECDVVEHLITRECPLGLATAVGPRGKLVIEEGRQADRRIRQPITQGLRACIHHLGIAEALVVENVE